MKQLNNVQWRNKCEVTTSMIKRKQIILQGRKYYETRKNIRKHGL